jgi:hypothetical protein
MHSSHPANFGFNEEVVSRSNSPKKTEDFGGCLSLLHQWHTQFPFLNQIPYSFYQTFQLEIPSNSMKSKF